MKRKDYANGYNCQIITENQFIIWNYISNNPWDTKDLIPSIEKLKENLKILPKNILADKWYASEENYEYLEKHNIKSYIPHPESNLTNLINYNYDKKTDTYKDIEWNIFKFKQLAEKKLFSEICLILISPIFTLVCFFILVSTISDQLW